MLVPEDVVDVHTLGREVLVLREVARAEAQVLVADRVDAGDIGAGHTVTAIYEVTPVGSDAIRNGPLRYSDEPQVAVVPGDGELGFFKLRYKEPGEATSRAALPSLSSFVCLVSLT